MDSVLTPQDQLPTRSYPASLLLSELINHLSLVILFFVVVVFNSKIKTVTVFYGMWPRRMAKNWAMESNTLDSYPGLTRR